MDSSETPNAPIVPDARYQAIAEAYTLDAIDHANAAFKIALDRSGVQQFKIVDKIVAGRPPPTQEQLVLKAYRAVTSHRRRRHAGAKGNVRLAGLKTVENVAGDELRRVAGGHGGAVRRLGRLGAELGVELGYGDIRAEQ